jgi:hypothetical protein
MPGSILELPASMVTLALKSALFPKNMLSTRLPAALKVSELGFTRAPLQPAKPPR